VTIYISENLVKRSVNINKELTIEALATLLDIRSVDVVKHLFQKMHIMRMVTGKVDAKTATRLAQDLGHEVTNRDL